MRHSFYRFLFACSFLTLFAGNGVAEDPIRTLPGGHKVEELPQDRSQIKIVLIAGSSFYKPGEHEYLAGCAALMDLLRQTPGVFPVLAIDWPRNPETLKSARAVVMLFDGGDKHGLLVGDRLAQVEQLAKQGAGLVFLHQLVDAPVKIGKQVRGLSGAVWEKGYSARAHWVARFEKFPDHPVFQGVAPFEIDDGWLTDLRFSADGQGMTPLLRTSDPKAKTPAKSATSSVVAWTFNRADKGRSLGFTGGHLHQSLLEEGYRRFLINGILWTAGLDIPSTGAPVALTKERLNASLRPVRAPAR